MKNKYIKAAGWGILGLAGVSLFGKEAYESIKIYQEASQVYSGFDFHLLGETLKAGALSLGVLSSGVLGIRGAIKSLVNKDSKKNLEAELN